MTPAPPDDLPWLAWAIVIITLALIAQIPMLIQHRRTREDVRTTRDDVAQVKEQVANTHSTNLRVDIDAAKASASDAATDAKLAAEASHRTERLVEDLVKSIRAGEHSADRRYELHAKEIETVRADLDAHLDEIPAILDHAFAEHCPKRHPDQP